MLKQVFGHGIIYTLANILTRGISFLLLPFYTRVLSPVDYGLFDIMLLIVNFVNLTIALEVNQAIARYLHDLSQELKVKYVSTAFNFTILVYLLFSLVMSLSEKYVSNFIFEGFTDEKGTIYKLLILLIFINGLYYFLQNQLRWNLQVKENAIVNIVNSISTIIVTMILVLKFDQGIIGVVVGLISGNLIGSIMAFVKSKDYYRIIFDKAILQKMLAFSFPLVPSSIAVFFNLYIDRLIIKSYLGLDAVGLYAVAYKFATIINLVIIGFQSSLTPLIYANYKNADAPESIEKIFRIFILFIMVLGSGISIFSKEVLILFTHSEFFSAYTIIAPLTFATVFSNLYIFTPGMAIKNKTKLILLINIIVVTVNIILCISLIGKLGLYGIGVSLLVSNFIAFILYLSFSQRLYKIPFQYMTLIKIFGFILILLVIPLLLVTIKVKIGLYLITCMALLLILINRRELSILVLKAKSLKKRFY